ncbi:hypothetical protein ACFRI7_33670 [Streptomyces sp. NPDC056716]|uniref:hypothetical protein n=1 Tax=unclassified Streptomyces TaxID=2593676 RepID=UPI0036CE504E
MTSRTRLPGVGHLAVLALLTAFPLTVSCVDNARSTAGPRSTAGREDVRAQQIPKTVSPTSPKEYA